MNSIKGRHSKIVTEITSGFTDWTAFVRKFIHEFMPVDQTYKLKQELQQCTQHLAENL